MSNLPPEQMTAQPFTKAHCRCMPWQQSWRAETPGWCATCGLPFASAVAARSVCLETAGCLLLPDHEGSCAPNTEKSSQ